MRYEYGKRKNYIEIDVLQMLRAILHKAWLVILLVLILGGAAFSYASLVCLIVPNGIIFLLFRKTDEFRYFVCLTKSLFGKLKNQKAGKEL